MNKYFKYSLIAAILCSASYVIAEEEKAVKIEETSVSLEDQVELSRIWAYDVANACKIYEDEAPFNSDVFMKGYDFFMENPNVEVMNSEARTYIENEQENFFRGACVAAGIIKMIEAKSPDFINKEAIRAGFIDAFNGVELPSISQKFADHDVVVNYHKTLEME